MILPEDLFQSPAPAGGQSGSLVPGPGHHHRLCRLMSFAFPGRRDVGLDFGTEDRIAPAAGTTFQRGHEPTLPRYGHPVRRSSQNVGQFLSVLLLRVQRLDPRKHFRPFLLLRVQSLDPQRQSGQKEYKKEALQRDAAGLLLSVFGAERLNLHPSRRRRSRREAWSGRRPGPAGSRRTPW